MSESLSLFMLSTLFVCLALAWLALPLIPALRELRRPTDETPLHVNGGNAADARDGLASTLAQVFATPDAIPSSSALTIWRNPELSGAQAQASAGLAPALASPGTLVLQGAQNTLHSVHARELVLGSDLCTSTRLSAQDRAKLLPGARFQVLQAPLIRTPALVPLATPLAGTRAFPGAAQGAVFAELQGWWAGRDIVVGPDTLVSGDIVARGSVTLKRGARVCGSVKAAGGVTLHEGAQISANLVSASAELGPSTWVGGSVIVQNRVTLARGAQVGSPASAASVNADFVTLHDAVQVFGGIYARHHAQAV